MVRGVECNRARDLRAVSIVEVRGIVGLEGGVGGRWECEKTREGGRGKK